jgi:hypothetical protein
MGKPGEVVEEEELELEEEELATDEPGTDGDDEPASEGGDGTESATGAESEHADEEAGEEETAEEASARTQRNRDRRAAKKAAQHEREERLKAELSARDALIYRLQDQVNQIQRRNQGADLAQIDQQLQQLNSAYLNEQQALSDAFTSQDGAAHARATNNMLEIRSRFENLQGVRRAVIQQQQQPAPLDPRVGQYAQDWASRNSWYDPSGRDDDSRVAKSIDDSMAREGGNPAMPQYWEELDRRLARYLPHRYSQPATPRRTSTSPPPAPRSPVAGAGRQASPTNGGGQARLSPERVAAIKDAGMWNDPVKRQKMIEGFKKYDAEHKA